MKEEKRDYSKIAELVSPRDQEIILLTSILFWAKYMRRNINSEDFVPEKPKVDFSDPSSIVHGALELQRQLNNDIEGDVVEAILKVLLNHRVKTELFPNLSDERIGNILYELDNLFEEQEVVMFLEQNSYYFYSGPEEFATRVAQDILWLLGGDLEIGWFSSISGWRERELVIKAVIAEKLSNLPAGISRLLSNGE